MDVWLHNIILGTINIILGMGLDPGITKINRFLAFKGLSNGRDRGDTEIIRKQ